MHTKVTIYIVQDWSDA